MTSTRLRSILCATPCLCFHFALTPALLAHLLQRPRTFDLLRISHCQPEACGEICASILGQEWSPVLSVASVCLTLQSMLASCKVRSSVECPRPYDNWRLET